MRLRVSATISRLLSFCSARLLDVARNCPPFVCQVNPASILALSAFTPLQHRLQSRSAGCGRQQWDDCSPLDLAQQSGSPAEVQEVAAKSWKPETQQKVAKNIRRVQEVVQDKIGEVVSSIII